jgi:hypothetical protein
MFFSWQHVKGGGGFQKDRSDVVQSEEIADRDYFWRKVSQQYVVGGGLPDF